MKLRSTFIILCILSALAVNAQDKNDKKVYHSIILNVNGESVEVQALLLDSGRISLYKLIDYYIKVSTPTQSFIFKLISEDNQYISQLGEHMADCATLKKLIRKTKFNTKDLTQIVHLYNNCEAIEKDNLYKPTLSVSLGTGISFIKSSFRTDDQHKNLNWSFDKTRILNGSIAITPPRKRNISFGVDVSFSKHSIHAYENKRITQNSSYERFLESNYTQFTGGILFTHSIAPGKRIQPYYTLIVGRTFNRDAKTEAWQANYNDDGSLFINEINIPLKIQNSFQLSAAIGTKVSVIEKCNVVFEFRFDLQPNHITGEGISAIVYIFTPTLRFSFR